MLATQTLIQKKAKNMRVTVDGQLPAGVTAKDIILAIIGEIGTAGGTGHVIEYAGEAIRALSMEGRMTVCNMSIEGGARAGLIAPDEKTFAYLKGRPKAPKGEAWDKAVRYWRTLVTDEGAHFDREVRLDAANLPPIVTWGTSPEDVVSITGVGAAPGRRSPTRRSGRRSRARSTTWASRAASKIQDIAIDRVFIGSCTNGRIEDLRAVAKIVEGKTVNANVNAMIVPGSGLVKEQAEAEGLDKIFKAAGFEWREPGCSMCLAMNADKLAPGERCASTSNRNFEGRQGFKGRTHLVSPIMAAAAAIAGRVRRRARAGAERHRLTLNQKPGLAPGLFRSGHSFRAPDQLLRQPVPPWQDDAPLPALADGAVSSRRASRSLAHIGVRQETRGR